MKNPHTFKFKNKPIEDQFHRVEDLLHKMRLHFVDIGYYFISSIESENDLDFKVSIQFWDANNTGEFIGANYPFGAAEREFTIKFNKDETDEQIIEELEKANKEEGSRKVNKKSIKPICSQSDLMMLFINVIRILYINLFSQWASVPIWRKKALNQFFIPAIKGFIDKDKKYLEASESGLFHCVNNLENTNSSMYTDYFSRTNLDYEDLMKMDIRRLDSSLEKSCFKLLSIFVWMLKQPLSPYGSLYSAMDRVYLFVNYLFARKYGATPVQAVHWANKWLPFQPAQFLPSIAQVGRKTGMGQLWSIIYYSIPRFIETHFTRPWVIIGTTITILISVVMFPLSLGVLFFNVDSNLEKNSNK